MTAAEGIQDPSVVRRYGTLLAIADSVATHRELPDLLHDLLSRLRQVEGFDYLEFALYDSNRSVLRHQWITSEGATPVEDISVEGNVAGEVFRSQEPLLIADTTLDSRCHPLEGNAPEVRSIYFCPLQTARGCFGVVGFGSKSIDAWSESARELLQAVASVFALRVDDVIARNREREYEDKLSWQREHCLLMLDINRLLFSELDPQGLFAAVSQSIRRLIRHDFAFLVLQEPGTHRFRLHAMDGPPGATFFKPGAIFPVGGATSKIVLQTRRPFVANGDEIAAMPGELARHAYQEGARSMCWVPLLVGNRELGTLCVAGLEPDSFSAEDVELLSHVGQQIALALENAFAFGQVAELIDKLEQEKLYLENEVGSPYRSEDIIGHSEALSYVLEQVRTVAPALATVLVLGETGTGKELIARAIHRLSDRNQGPFVKLNCAAIPTGLLESELFGHEKGAFTGAIQQKIGRLELANKGTLFLDEVGDIPLELQPKLLRVLQEQEFERLGSNQTLHVNVRIVAATHRNLETMVQSGEFRRDLYYRLNVFPIHVPPLRDRTEDIPLLVRHFVSKFANRMNRRIGTIPPATMQALTRWQWPGNVRELENLIERAVILSPGRTLNVPLSEMKSGSPPAPAATLADADRAHILRVLEETKGVIAGVDGAAARLGIKRTTLNYKMKKLGINPRSR